MIETGALLPFLNRILLALDEELDVRLGALYILPAPAGLLLVLVLMFSILPDGAIEHGQSPAVALALGTTEERPTSRTPSALCVVPWPAVDEDHVQGMPQVPTSWSTVLDAPAQLFYLGCSLVEPKWLLVETAPATHYARMDPTGCLHKDR
jgi:hypothetical protein